MDTAALSHLIWDTRYRANAEPNIIAVFDRACDAGLKSFAAFRPRPDAEAVPCPAPSRPRLTPRHRVP